LVMIVHYVRDYVRDGDRLLQLVRTQVGPRMKAVRLRCFSLGIFRWIRVV
jgi:hypothetical protein